MRPATLLRILGLIAVAGWMGGCREEAAPVAPESRGIAFAISDGAHGGNAQFYWLPPLVPAPSPPGTFDGSRSPVVAICAWDGTACTALIAEFTTTTGPGSETVRVAAEDEHYVVNWHTDQFDLDPALTYRIEVSVAGSALGHADVDPVTSGGELKKVDTGEFIALKDGRTLPIKFRIEERPPPFDPSIEPTTGIPTTFFTITDPSGRIEQGDLAVFYQTATDPTVGTIALNIVVTTNPDGSTTLTGNVPATLAQNVQHFVTVGPTLTDLPRFGDLAFFVIPS